jgi:hypothetical protein
MSLTIMSAASASSVWALGPNKSVVHYDGSSWGQLPTPVGPLSLYGISAVSASTVWVSGSANTGSNATVAFWDGASWTLQTTALGRTETVYALATVPGTSVAFAATYGDNLLVYSQTPCQQVVYAPFPPLPPPRPPNPPPPPMPPTLWIKTVVGQFGSPGTPSSGLATSIKLQSPRNVLLTDNDTTMYSCVSRSAAARRAAT